MQGLVGCAGDLAYTLSRTESGEAETGADLGFHRCPLVVRWGTAHHEEGKAGRRQLRGVQVGDAKEVTRVVAVEVKIKGWVWSVF